MINNRRRILYKRRGSSVVYIRYKNKMIPYKKFKNIRGGKTHPDIQTMTDDRRTFEYNDRVKIAIHKIFEIFKYQDIDDYNESFHSQDLYFETEELKTVVFDNVLDVNFQKTYLYWYMHVKLRNDRHLFDFHFIVKDMLSNIHNNDKYTFEYYWKGSNMITIIKIVYKKKANAYFDIYAYQFKMKNVVFAIRNLHKRIYDHRIQLYNELGDIRIKKILQRIYDKYLRYRKLRKQRASLGLQSSTYPPISSSRM